MWNHMSSDENERVKFGVNRIVEWVLVDTKYNSQFSKGSIYRMLRHI